MRITQQIIIYSLLLLLFGCGFQLRGQARLPSQLKYIALQTDSSYGLFAEQFKQTLIKAGVIITDDVQSAPILLKLSKEMFNQQSTATGATNQLITYTLSYSTSYQLFDNKGRPIIAARPIIVTRSFAANNNQLLGSSNEQTMLQQDMRREAIMQIINQLNSKQILKAINAKNP